MLKDNEGRLLVEEAMKEWMDYTCIRFKQHENEADYVEFVYKPG